MDDQRRLGDKLMIELQQSFKDFVQRYERDKNSEEERYQRDRQEVMDWQEGHEKKSDDWRKTLEERIKPWEDFVKSVNMGWKIVIVFSGGVAFVYKFTTWALGHVRING